MGFYIFNEIFFLILEGMLNLLFIFFFLVIINVYYYFFFSFKIFLLSGLVYIVWRYLFWGKKKGFCCNSEIFFFLIREICVWLGFYFIVLLFGIIFFNGSFCFCLFLISFYFCEEVKGFKIKFFFLC